MADKTADPPNLQQVRFRLANQASFLQLENNTDCAKQAYPETLRSNARPIVIQHRHEIWVCHSPGNDGTLTRPNIRVSQACRFFYGGLNEALTGAVYPSHGQIL